MNLRDVQKVREQIAALVQELTTLRDRVAELEKQNARRTEAPKRN